MEKGVSLRVNLKDNLEVGVFLAKFRQSGLGSSRELGSLFKRSASTVINKQRCSRLGSKRLVDGRRQKTRYKLEELKAEILLIWVRSPQASDKDMLEQLEPRLSALGMRLDLRSLKRHLKETGIEEARSRLRAEDILTNEATAVAKDNHAQNNTTSGGNLQDKSEEKQITQTPSRYAGQMLSIPQLCRIGFSEMVKVLPSSEDCLYSKENYSTSYIFFMPLG